MLDPNTLYDSSHASIFTLSNTTDTNQFCNTYNHNNKYNGLKLGQRIEINDGTYNKLWYIAGFDCEYNKVASDGKSYDNGYGIALIPETHLIERSWGGSSGYTLGGYINSTMHTSILHTIANNLKNVLGTHLVNRNVLLSSSVNSDGRSNKYTWTTAYATLMSAGQMTGIFALNHNKYDDGEANYKLPLFNYMEYKTGYTFWLRGIDYNFNALIVDSNGDITGYHAGEPWGVLPLIYIR